ncbi:MAG: prenyltransferase/squalene oxidase repeat-containing protein [Candidatus Dojkabacteria bacterium]
MNYSSKKDIEVELQSILHSLKSGDINPSAYDTAWVARIPNKEKTGPRFSKCLEWVLNNQQEDGSWGATDVLYYHDRIINTLASILTLKNWNSSNSIINKGIDFVNENLINLKKDHHDTIGFELLLPSIVKKLENLGILFNDTNKVIIDSYVKLGEKKLSKIPLETLYVVKTNLSHSMEFLDGFNLDFKKINSTQMLGNGSFGNSPAATSFMLMQVEDSLSEKYIMDLLNTFGDFVPSIYPFEIFERGWILDSINYCDIKTQELGEVVDYLKRNWSDKNGISISNTFPYTDLDDTSLIFKTLTERNIEISQDTFQFYKRGEVYVCFPFELDPSVSTYVHFLGALNSIKSISKNLEIDRINIIKYIYLFQEPMGFWFDKWHISPFYTTSHLLIELLKYNNGSDVEFNKALEWIIDSQNIDGGWGYFDKSTIEETAYVLEFLIYYYKEYTVDKSNLELISKGIEYLKSKGSVEEEFISSLWIDKGLYSTKTINKVLFLCVIYLHLQLKEIFYE